MKKLFKAYNSYTRTERLGIVALLILLAVLIIVRFTMHFWVHPDFNTDEGQKMSAAWDAIQNDSNREHTNAPVPVPGGYTDTVNRHREATELQPAGLFPFDPNTLDSAGFIKLGLRAKTVSILLHWRAKGKKFYRKEDFQPLYTLSDEEYKRLAPYITISNTAAKKIDLNKADSIQLIALRGIGAKLAHRILERRRSAGRFERVEQLQDIYPFPDSTIQQLKAQLYVE